MFYRRNFFCVRGDDLPFSSDVVKLNEFLGVYFVNTLNRTWQVFLFLVERTAVDVSQDKYLLDAFGD